jgi:hypothetical protein
LRIQALTLLTQSANNNLAAVLSARRRVALGYADVFIAFTVALVALGSVPRFMRFDSASITFGGPLEINAGELLAFIAVWSVSKSRDTEIKLSNFDLFVLAGCSLFFLPPEPQNLPFLGATVAGAYLLWRHTSPQVRSVAQLWLALAACEAWGRVLFRVVAVPVLRLEAILVVKLGHVFGLGLSLDGVIIRAPTGWTLYLLDACSSFHNISLAFLVWLSLLKLSRATVDLLKIIGLLIGVIAIIFLNAIRVILMTASEDSYLFWHQGQGTVIYSCLALLAIAVPTLTLLRKDNP